jgi:hypothetical protein
MLERKIIGLFSTEDVPMIKFLLPGMLIALALSASAAASDYHGFHIDESAQRLAPDASASLTSQLDIVESSGLPPEVLAALKQTPIVVDPGLRGNPGIFAVRAGAGAVYIRPVAFAPNKPILLHELLHAYHFRVLRLERPEIQQAYQHARQDGVFPASFQSAHFLENAKEFFAVTGTLYVFGDIQQPPFSCAALARLDAGYLAFLAEQFGPHACHAQGQ